MTAIERFETTLPHGITLSCRAAGPEDAPRLVFLHGFPEAAFVWDALLAHFGDRYRCIAPNLRGYEHSSAPAEVEAYRPKHIVQDIAALIDQQGGRVAALVAHDWGGAAAWNLAVQHPAKLERLVIVNSPHPATFLRELQNSPAQQAASSYMNFLRRPDAGEKLRANGYARLWPFFEAMGAASGTHEGAGWLDEATRARYREVWDRGLEGALNYYRASPLHPPTEEDKTVLGLSFPPEAVTVKVPTLVIWAEADTALPVGLLDGLEAYVPQLRLVRVPGATHWILHERPRLVAAEIDTMLRS